MSIPTILKRHMSTLMLMLFVSTLAMAQNDDGQYQILRALYGTARNNVDVTERLRELARRDLTFRMGNSTFGVDPDPGVIKILRIYTQGRNGQDRMFEYTEGSTVEGSLFAGWGGGNWGRGEWKKGWGDDHNVRIGGGGDYTSLNIISATYGAGRQRRDVTDRVRSMVRDGLLHITVNNETLGVDPAPNVRKALWVTFSTDRGRSQEVRVDEGQRLSVP